MSASFFLAAASDTGTDLFFALFLAFGIAAVIWLIVWLLSDADGGGGDDSDPAAKAAPAKASSPSAAGSEEVEIPDDFEAATEEEAASLFSGELSDGSVKQDPVYGIIYTDAPDEVDDLKQIKGVAKVLEGKLNGIGVYRFKQVAVWTDAACQEFSKLLTFKNRIYTDNWIAQAKDFHAEKYGEKL